METIEAFADETVFRNDENGYTVLVVKAGKSRVSAVGVMPPVTSGEKLRITGEWTEHPVYGRQIKVQSLEIEQPTTLSGIEKYLSSGMIRGVGPATAKLLIRAFGEKTLDVLYSEPERLLEVSGIGEKRARMIQESYAEQAQQREAMVFLQSYGVTPALAVKIYKRYGENVRQVITRNPYRLVEDVEGIGFKTADRIAASLGIEQDSEYRLSAGVKYTLSDATAVAGHCYLPRPELALAARRILGNDPDLIERTIDSLILSHEIAAQILPGDDNEDVVALYLPSTYRAESEVARRLREMIDAMPDTMATDLSAQIDELERVEGIAFHAQQRQAIETAVTSGMTVITGGPGTGKTTIIKCIIKLLSVHGDIALAAPTGRAAKRMSEVTGEEAKTIHRLLQVDWDEKDNPVFTRNERNPLECDCLVVDELSMVDAYVFESLLRALPFSCRLVLVGDNDQLPSVGAGNVLGDLIASGLFPTVQLKEIFRQSQESLIVMSAHRIVEGKLPDLRRHDSDFFFLPQEDPQKAAQLIVSLCSVRLPRSYGYSSVTDIQVLCPGRKGELGTVELNKHLREAINPPARGKAEVKVNGALFRLGDKVMQIRNDYNLPWAKEDGTAGEGVFNGDMGVITEIDKPGGAIHVRIDDKDVVYDFERASNELEPAYAVTVHKSQGNEFPAVVIPVLDPPRQLCYRNLLYTGVTRAKQLLILVGQRGVVSAMIENDRKTRRYTGLKHFLEREE